jgi:uncharacterized protein (TIGR02270 family)
MMQSSIIPFVIEQHAEELATLWATRNGLAANGHLRLRHLARFDERIAAHEDGCVLGGAEALRVLIAQLATMSAGRVFGAAVAALDLNDRATIAQCLALIQASPEARGGMTSALGWVSAVRLTGIVKDLLTAPSTIQRSLGLAACRLHGVDPGSALPAALKDPGNDVRAEAVRAAGVLGQADLASYLSSLVDEDAACQFWSVWSAVMLGDRGRGLDTLMNVALSASQHRRRAFRLVCQAMSTTAAHEALRRLAVDSAQIRWLIEGSGIAGDPKYVPWLIGHMASEKTARLGGEAFCLITGLDLGESKLEGQRPENFESGPNDDPNDPNVDMDPDDGLPWPDPEKIETWWAANGSRFQAGTRCFMGALVTREHCIDVLKNGYQRQRILAAHYLCLLEPGTPLFNTSAPAWRQERLLAKMK